MAFKKVGDFKGIVPQDFQGLDDFNECADVNFFLYFFHMFFSSLAIVLPSITVLAGSKTGDSSYWSGIFELYESLQELSHLPGRKLKILGTKLLLQ